VLLLLLLLPLVLLLLLLAWSSIARMISYTLLCPPLSTHRRQAEVEKSRAT
jgi:hypothetical protein